MFDFSGSELLLIVVVAVVVIGPKDLPRALRLAGQWVAKIRRVSGHFRTGIETMIREAELEEMERTWREQNEAIMKQHPQSTLPASPPAEAAHHDPASLAPVTQAETVHAESVSREDRVEAHLPPPP